MDDELRAALAGLEQRLSEVGNRVTGQGVHSRTTMMQRFDRVEDRLGGLDSRVGVNVTQLAGLIEALTSREQQLEMLQDAICAGITAEHGQVRSMRQTIVEM